MAGLTPPHSTGGGLRSDSAGLTPPPSTGGGLRSDSAVTRRRRQVSTHSYAAFHHLMAQRLAQADGDKHTENAPATGLLR